MAVLFLSIFWLVEIVSVHMAEDDATVWTLITVQVFAGLLAGSFKSRRAHTHAIAATAALWGSLMVLDHLKVEPWQPETYSMLVAFASGLVAFTLWKPFWIPSDPFRSDSIFIAFYRGQKAPWISKALSIFGFPVYGVAIICGDYAMVPSGKTGKMVRRKSIGIASRLSHWNLVDTTVAATRKQIEAFDQIENVSIDTIVGPLGCLHSLKTFLYGLGNQYAIGACMTPAAYCSKVLRALDPDKAVI